MKVQERYDGAESKYYREKGKKKQTKRKQRKNKYNASGHMCLIKDDKSVEILKIIKNDKCWCAEVYVW